MPRIKISSDEYNSDSDDDINILNEAVAIDQAQDQPLQEVVKVLKQIKPRSWVYQHSEPRHILK